ncbi:uncharacterized protein LOC133532807 [Cydia pomonella]|uniref:uncharacterized protein LOC133532807 n=1 Tax=Cydia pomonella TaxID=82600 RepID=UPI002ADE2009|nr:uncharacterized protein LOC133532807 [Cydia pomonella]
MSLLCCRRHRARTDMGAALSLHPQEGEGCDGAGAPAAPPTMADVIRERKKKAGGAGLGTLRRRIAAAARRPRDRPDRGCEHARFIRGVVSSWRLAEVFLLCEELEAGAALRDLVTQAELAREPAPALHAQLHALQQDRRWCDVELVGSGWVLPAHRALLAARCSYFRELLLHYPSGPCRVPLEGALAELPRGDVEALVAALYAGPHALHYSDTRHDTHCERGFSSDGNLDIINVESGGSCSCSLGSAGSVRRLAERLGARLDDLHRDMRYLLDSGEYADARLVFAAEGGAAFGFRCALELPCHRAVLAARSRFFRSVMSRRTAGGAVCVDEKVLPRRFARALLHAAYTDQVGTTCSPVVQERDVAAHGGRRRVRGREGAAAALRQGSPARRLHRPGRYHMSGMSRRTAGGAVCVDEKVLPRRFARALLHAAYTDQVGTTCSPVVQERDVAAHGGRRRCRSGMSRRTAGGAVCVDEKVLPRRFARALLHAAYTDQVGTTCSPVVQERDVAAHGGRRRCRSGMSRRTAGGAVCVDEKVLPRRFARALLHAAYTDQVGTTCSPVVQERDVAAHGGRRRCRSGMSRRTAGGAVCVDEKVLPRRFARALLHAAYTDQVGTTCSPVVQERDVAAHGGRRRCRSGMSRRTAGGAVCVDEKVLPRRFARALLHAAYTDQVGTTCSPVVQERDVAAHGGRRRCRSGMSRRTAGGAVCVDEKVLPRRFARALLHAAYTDQVGTTCSPVVQERDVAAHGGRRRCRSGMSRRTAGGAVCVDEKVLPRRFARALLHAAYTDQVGTTCSPVVQERDVAAHGGRRRCRSGMSRRTAGGAVCVDEKVLPRRFARALLHAAYTDQVGTTCSPVVQERDVAAHGGRRRCRSGMSRRTAGGAVCVDEKVLPRRFARALLHAAYTDQVGTTCSPVVQERDVAAHGGRRRCRSGMSRRTAGGAVCVDEKVLPRRFARALLHAAYTDQVDLTLIGRASSSPTNTISSAAAWAGVGRGAGRGGAPSTAMLDDAAQLYEIARFLEMPIVAQGCEDAIVSALCPESLPHVLRWTATPVASQWVHRQAMRYLRDEFPSIMSHAAAAKLPRAALAAALASPFTQCSEAQALRALLRLAERAKQAAAALASPFTQCSEAQALRALLRLAERAKQAAAALASPFTQCSEAQALRALLRLAERAKQAAAALASPFTQCSEAQALRALLRLAERAKQAAAALASPFAQCSEAQALRALLRLAERAKRAAAALASPFTQCSEAQALRAPLRLAERAKQAAAALASPFTQCSEAQALRAPLRLAERAKRAAAALASPFTQCSEAQALRALLRLAERAKRAAAALASPFTQCSEAQALRALLRLAERAKQAAAALASPFTQCSEAQALRAPLRLAERAKRAAAALASPFTQCSEAQALRAPLRLAERAKRAAAALASPFTQCSEAQALRALLRLAERAKRAAAALASPFAQCSEAQALRALLRLAERAKRAAAALASPFTQCSEAQALRALLRLAERAKRAAAALASPFTQCSEAQALRALLRLAERAKRAAAALASPFTQCSEAQALRALLRLAERAKRAAAALASPFAQCSEAQALRALLRLAERAKRAAAALASPFAQCSEAQALRALLRLAERAKRAAAALASPFTQCSEAQALRAPLRLAERAKRAAAALASPFTQCSEAQALRAPLRLAERAKRAAAALASPFTQCSEAQALRAPLRLAERAKRAAAALASPFTQCSEAQALRAPLRLAERAKQAAAALASPFTQCSEAQALRALLRLAERAKRAAAALASPFTQCSEAQALRALLRLAERAKRAEPALVWSGGGSRRRRSLPDAALGGALGSLAALVRTEHLGAAPLAPPLHQAIRRGGRGFLVRSGGWGAWSWGSFLFRFLLIIICSFSARGAPWRLRGIVCAPGRVTTPPYTCFDTTLIDIKEARQACRNRAVCPRYRTVQRQPRVAGMVAAPAPAAEGARAADAWLGRGAYRPPRYFLPYLDELKALLEDQAVPEAEVARIRRSRYLHRIPDTLYMVAAERGGAPDAPSPSRCAAESACVSPRVLAALRARARELRAAPPAARALALQASDRKACSLQVCGQVAAVSGRERLRVPARAGGPARPGEGAARRAPRRAGARPAGQRQEGVQSAGMWPGGGGVRPRAPACPRACWRPCAPGRGSCAPRPPPRGRSPCRPATGRRAVCRYVARWRRCPAESACVSPRVLAALRARARELRAAPPAARALALQASDRKACSLQVCGQVAAVSGRERLRVPARAGGPARPGEGAARRAPRRAGARPAGQRQEGVQSAGMWPGGGGVRPRAPACPRACWRPCAPGRGSCAPRPPPRGRSPCRPATGRRAVCRYVARWRRCPAESACVSPRVLAALRARARELRAAPPAARALALQASDRKACSLQVCGQVAAVSGRERLRVPARAGGPARPGEGAARRAPRRAGARPAGQRQEGVQSAGMWPGGGGVRPRAPACPRACWRPCAPGRGSCAPRPPPRGRSPCRPATGRRAVCRYVARWRRCPAESACVSPRVLAALRARARELRAAPPAARALALQASDRKACSLQVCGQVAAVSGRERLRVPARAGGPARPGEGAARRAPRRAGARPAGQRQEGVQSAGMWPGGGGVRPRAPACPRACWRPCAPGRGSCAPRPPPRGRSPCRPATGRRAVCRYVARWRRCPAESACVSPRVLAALRARARELRAAPPAARALALQASDRKACSLQVCGQVAAVSGRERLRVPARAGGPARPGEGAARRAPRRAGARPAGQRQEGVQSAGMWPGGGGVRPRAPACPRACWRPCAPGRGSCAPRPPPRGRSPCRPATGRRAVCRYVARWRRCPAESACVSPRVLAALRARARELRAAPPAARALALQASDRKACSLQVCGQVAAVSGRERLRVPARAGGPARPGEGAARRAPRRAGARPAGQRQEGVQSAGMWPGGGGVRPRAPACPRACWRPCAPGYARNIALRAVREISLPDSCAELLLAEPDSEADTSDRQVFALYSGNPLPSVEQKQWGHTSRVFPAPFGSALLREKEQGWESPREPWPEPDCCRYVYCRAPGSLRCASAGSLRAQPADQRGAAERAGTCRREPSRLDAQHRRWEGADGLSAAVPDVAMAPNGNTHLLTARDLARLPHKEYGVLQLDLGDGATHTPRPGSRAARAGRPPPRDAAQSSSRRSDEDELRAAIELSVMRAYSSFGCRARLAPGAAGGAAPPPSAPPAPPPPAPPGGPQPSGSRSRGSPSPSNSAHLSAPRQDHAATLDPARRDADREFTVQGAPPLAPPGGPQPSGSGSRGSPSPSNSAHLSAPRQDHAATLDPARRDADREFTVQGAPPPAPPGGPQPSGSGSRGSPSPSNSAHLSAPRQDHAATLDPARRDADREFTVQGAPPLAPPGGPQPSGSGSRGSPSPSNSAHLSAPRQDHAATLDPARRDADREFTVQGAPPPAPPGGPQPSGSGSRGSPSPSNSAHLSAPRQDHAATLDPARRDADRGAAPPPPAPPGGPQPSGSRSRGSPSPSNSAHLSAPRGAAPPPPAPPGGPQPSGSRSRGSPSPSNSAHLSAPRQDHAATLDPARRDADPRCSASAPLGLGASAVARTPSPRRAPPRAPLRAPPHAHAAHATHSAHATHDYRDSYGRGGGGGA